MAQQPTSSNPLENLSSTVRHILVQTGKVFKDPTKHSQKHLMHTNAQMKQVISQSMNQFHEALDDIEIEILLAKATMERDLAVARAKRVAKEQEAAAERSRKAAEEAAKVSNAPVEDHLMNDVENVHEEDRKMEVDMTDEPADAQNEAETETSVLKEDPSASKVEDEASLDRKNDPEPPPSLDMSSISNRTAHEGKESADVAPTSTEQPGDAAKVSEKASGDETPATAGLKDLNFESMFELDGGGSDVDYDLDFSVPGDGNQTMLGDDLFTGTTGDNDPQMLPSNSSEDISSLLPGLESYANDVVGNDFSILDIPTTSASAANIDPKGQSSQPLPSTTASADLLQAESNFDDLFVTGDMVMDDGNDEMGDDTLGEGSEFLDAAFFNMDGT